MPATAQIPNGPCAEEDVQLVMTLASCSREDAVKALGENGGDVTKAVMAVVYC
ncbi:hypothetical protein BJ508DRAFT_333384 [Ascobolus immersus RN42]|uniref:Nascent polypeptide-associated complex subunit alpha-like UBA domain-containing protein n=1 Tax=Ascobolus immersus RN42 TaxID=1160509 RepID=A0A3N4HWU8_ASCIM|nr:hypothetical protein BJ508DRAFT_333384 [Ascobolus immersus RN42]